MSGPGPMAHGGSGFGPPPGLGQLVRPFAHHPSPRLLALAAVLFAVLRLSAGPPGWADAAVALVLVGAQPFVEWLLHVCVLHARPVSWRGRRVELDLARYHRLHHGAPTDPRWQFIPLRDLALGLALSGAAAWWILPDAPLRWTALAASAALALWYEWIHYLVHTRYRPRSAWLRRVWRHHRLHHFKNEHYWFGITARLGDRVLGTLADPATVPTSPTCRTLARERDLGALGP